jgi:glutathione peroxidase
MIYDISVKDNREASVSLDEYKGKVLLIVNTATGCGFTPQYKGLQELYEKYRDRGFEILDFPCNQFANQAPGNDSEIQEFCTGRFGVSFKIFSKIEVNGPGESPLFAYLKDKKRGFPGKDIKWNFTKFLVDRDGRVVKRFAPVVTPEKLERQLAALL